MASVTRDPRNLTFFMGSNPEVSPINDYNEDWKAPKVQSIDADTGLPLWSVNTEICDPAGVEATKLKLAAAVKPTFAPRSSYVLDGDSFVVATAYIVKGTTRTAFSNKVVGALKPEAPVRPVTPVINKD